MQAATESISSCGWLRSVRKARASSTLFFRSPSATTICGVVEPGCEEDDAGVAVVQPRLLRDLLAGGDDVPAALEAVEQQRIAGARRPEEVEDVLGGLPYDPFVLLAHDGERCRRRAEPFRRPGR